MVSITCERVHIDWSVERWSSAFGREAIAQKFAWAGRGFHHLVCIRPHLGSCKRWSHVQVLKTARSWARSLHTICTNTGLCNWLAGVNLKWSGLGRAVWSIIW